MFAFFYIIALVPSLIAALSFIFSRKVHWIEWLASTAMAFIISGIMHGTAIYGMTRDIECLSGKIVKVIHMPQWIEEYQQRHESTSTDSKGKTHTKVWYTTEHETHHEYWESHLDFGRIQETKRIDNNLYKEILTNFGGKIEINGKQSCSHLGGDFDSGDNNIYVVNNKTGYIYPVTTTKEFKNKIKAAPTVFSFAKVPTNAPVYLWPENPDYMRSDRVLGVCKINTREWDLMCSRLGPKNKVNPIIIGFNNVDSMMGKWQQAAWIGGKKNDLVLCYGVNGTNIVWSFVFGWTEKEICKRNLETILLKNPINDSIIPLIEKEIIMNYVIKDWSKLDYITIEPPKWAYIALIFSMILTQGFFWWWARTNDINKGQ